MNDSNSPPTPISDSSPDSSPDSSSGSGQSSDKGGKFSYRTLPTAQGWRAEIRRKVSASRSSVSASQDGFDSEQAAAAWGQQTLAEFIARLAQRHQRHARKDKLKAQLFQDKQQRDEQVNSERLARLHAQPDVAELQQQQTQPDDHTSLTSTENQDDEHDQ
ncbi:MAG: DUF3622 domain-containing protein [Gammaproteobacteria bacterium]|nr:DUF3622 domain-containing protein [Gammaproteobacteria bacterium]